MQYFLLPSVYRAESIYKELKKMRKRQLKAFTMMAAGMMVCGCSYDDFGGYYAAYDEMGIAPSMVEQQGGDQFAEFEDNPFVRTSDENVSTFSVDADGAAYSIMRRYVKMGYTLDKGYATYPGYTLDKHSVRIEEYLNYFTFDYADPVDNEAVAINADLGWCPWNAEHRLLRLGLKGKPLQKAPLANYVFLIDVSGSMDSPDKIELLKSGLVELVGQLNPNDKISIITYSGAVRKLLEATKVSEASKIKKAIGKLNAFGCTNGGKALKMAYEEALSNYIEGGNNRVILGTDGDFNVGVTSTDALVEMVESYAKKGIYMTCCGFGTGNLNDAMMEKISNAGNGTYQYIDSENEMMKVFAHETGKFTSVANDTKCQVTFDSTLVSSYRLIGYENRVMSKEDFADDTKDAGEIGAGQTITALYEIVPTEAFLKWPYSKTLRHQIATFDVRYKTSLGSESRPLSLDILIEDYVGDRLGATPEELAQRLSVPSPSENLRFAAGVAAYGMVLRQSEYRGDADIDMAIRLVDGARSFDPHGYRAELVKLMQKINQSAWFNE